MLWRGKAKTAKPLAFYDRNQANSAEDLRHKDFNQNGVTSFGF